jgi:hypothetical protein
MESYVAKVVNFDVVKPQPPQPEVKAITAGTLTVDPPKPVILDGASVKGKGDSSKLLLGPDDVVAQVYEKLRKAMQGEMDLGPIKSDPKAQKEFIKKVLQSKGISNPSEHNVEVFQNAIQQGQSVDQATDAVRHDPIVFDLKGLGKIDATATQHGINVDGAKDTKWAPKGDGVLAFGNEPIGTDGGKNADAYATLKAKAQEAGIDTSKGYLDANDIKTLEAKDNLTMLVSNGDGTNQQVKPSELGITKMSLGGQAVNETDSAGNAVTTKGSFEMNGKTGLAEDMWLNSVPATAK